MSNWEEISCGSEARFFETLASEHEMMSSETAQQLAAIESFGDAPLIVMGASQPEVLLRWCKRAGTIFISTRLTLYLRLFVR
jgi:hypothetical protein